MNDSLVRQMAHQSITLAQSGSIIILDAFYATKQLLSLYREAQLFLISRVRINTCATAPFCSLPKTGAWPKALNLPDMIWSQQQALLAKVEVFERFVNLHALVLGILQLLALEFPQRIHQSCPH